MRRTLLISATLFAVGCLAAAGPAIASVCIQIGPAEAAEDPLAHVFVGTAVETQAFDQNALFHVEEIWHGGALPEWQAVQGVDTDHEIWSATTRFEVGTRYLVIAIRDGFVLRNHCGGTGRYSASYVGADRPTQVSRPTPSDRPQSWGVAAAPPWPLVGLGVASLVVIGAITWRRRPSRT